MAITEADRDRLKAAIAKGVRRAQIDGESVEYASLSEMLDALRWIEGELGGGAGSGPRVSYPKTGRGL